MTETDSSQPATKGDIAGLQTELKLKATKSDLADLRTELKTDIKGLDQKFDQKFGQIDQKFTQIDQRFGQIDQKFERIDKTLLSLGVEASKTNLRMDRLENNIMEALRGFKSELLSAFEASVMKGQMYSQKAVTHGDILSAHEEKLLNHETRLSSLEIK